VSEFFNTDFGVLCYYARNTLLMDSGKVSNKQGTWSLKIAQRSNLFVMWAVIVQQLL